MPSNDYLSAYSIILSYYHTIILYLDLLCGLDKVLADYCTSNETRLEIDRPTDAATLNQAGNDSISTGVDWTEHLPSIPSISPHPSLTSTKLSDVHRNATMIRELTGLPRRSWSARKGVKVRQAITTS
jgi:hypothetical protein